MHNGPYSKTALQHERVHAQPGGQSPVASHADRLAQSTLPSPQKQQPSVVGKHAELGKCGSQPLWEGQWSQAQS